MLSVAKRLKCQECGDWYELRANPLVRGSKLPENYPFCSARCQNTSLAKMLSTDNKIRDESEMVEQ